jgi:hypothetical protein
MPITTRRSLFRSNDLLNHMQAQLMSMQPRAHGAVNQRSADEPDDRTAERLAEAHLVTLPTIDRLRDVTVTPDDGRLHVHVHYRGSRQVFEMKPNGGEALGLAGDLFPGVITFDVLATGSADAIETAIDDHLDRIDQHLALLQGAVSSFNEAIRREALAMVQEVRNPQLQAKELIKGSKYYRD